MSRIRTLRARMTRLQESAKARGLVDTRSAAERRGQQWLTTLSDAELYELERALIEDDENVKAAFQLKLDAWAESGG